MSSPLRRSLPLRGQAESTRPAPPKPFSREWLSLPPEQQAVTAGRRPSAPTGRLSIPSDRLIAPSWLPSERATTILLVALLVLTSALVQTGWAPTVAGGADSDVAGNPAVPASGRLIDPTPTPSVVVPGVASGSTPDDGSRPSAAEPSEPEDETSDLDSISLAGSGSGGPAADDEAAEDEGRTSSGSDEDVADAEAADEDVADATRQTQAMEGALLPDYRILAYYGHPANENMGILGQFDKEELLAQLLDEAATYEAADPDRPVMPAFEVIASVAQGSPQEDESWLAHTDDETIMEYVEFTAEKGILLILDIQIGHTSVEEDLAKVEKYLRYRHVHLAIDPEFSMSGDDVPGEVVGGVDGKEVTYAQGRLVEICAEEGIPPKVLIVHRFLEGMIRSDERVKPVAGVQLIVNVDGFGTPAAKTEIYGLFATDKDPEYAGIKIFYDQDEPVMTAEEILDLDPSPIYVQYH